MIMLRSESMIETARLLLRPHLPSDFEGYAALWGGAPEGSGKPARQSPLGDLDQESAWARLLRFIGHWEVFRFGPFLVTERASGSIVGEAGVAYFKRGLGERFDSAPEAMWKVDDRHQGHGLASEAMADIMRWFDLRRPEDRIVCMIHDTNITSKRVALRLGFQQFDLASHHGFQVQLFERVRTKGEKR
jgi:RimJ/RimL family protein N-acetyltransferase